LKILHKKIIGVLIWIGLGLGLATSISRIAERSPQGTRQLYQYATVSRPSVTIRFPGNYPVAVGDFVFADQAEAYPPIGYISRVGDRQTMTGIPVLTNTAAVTFYPNAPPLADFDFLEYHSPAADLGWVVRTMLPPAKRAEITRLLVDTYLLEQEAIVAALRPIVTQSLRDAAVILREDLAIAFEKRAAQFQEIGQRYQQQWIEQRIVPLIRDEIWPIVREEAEPLVNQLALEVWREVSLFRFAWRYIYDRSGIPDESLTRAELQRFMQDKVAPIFESRLSEIVELQNRLIARISRNEPIRETISLAVGEIASDPQIQEIFGEVFREVMIENQQLRDSLTNNWNSPEAVAALQEINQRIDPTISELGVMLFGSADGEITPEFARVLRNRILHKDNRWFRLRLSSGGSFSADQELQVRMADPTGEIPYAPARPR
jgi:hypothetical protein